MATKVIMPKLSPTMEEGQISRWLKKEGDKVSMGEPLAEIDTDKATMEMQALANGVLRKILINEGQSAPLGQLDRDHRRTQRRHRVRCCLKLRSSQQAPEKEKQEQPNQAAGTARATAATATAGQSRRCREHASAAERRQRSATSRRL